MFGKDINELSVGIVRSDGSQSTLWFAQGSQEDEWTLLKLPTELSPGDIVSLYMLYIHVYIYFNTGVSDDT